MKRFGIVFTLCLMLCAGSSLAGPPLNGAYDSTDLGGLVYLGRYTEGWDFGGSAVISGASCGDVWSWPALTRQTRGFPNEALDVQLRGDFTKSIPVNGCSLTFPPSHGDPNASVDVPLLCAISSSAESAQKNEPS